MYLLGHTRFSVFEPESGSWRLSRAIGKTRTSAYLDQLYDPERLSARVEIFIGLALPILEKAQEGHHLLHVVSYSEELPDAVEEELIAACEKYDWLRLDKRTDRNRKGKSLDRWAQESFPKGEIYAEYRLDDDDLLSVEFFDSLSKFGNENFVGFIVSHGYGIQAFYGDGSFKEPRIEHRPKIAIGLARICKIDETGEIIGPRRKAHTLSDRVAPVILDSRRIMFLHSFHLTQDSGVDKPDGDLGNRLRNYLSLPPVREPESLTKAFPGVSFERAIDDRDRIKALVRAHSSLDSIKGIVIKATKRLKNAVV